MNSRAFPPVQQTKLDARPIRNPAHDPVQRIDLSNQMPLAQPADGRVARHHPDTSPTQRHQRRPRAHACRHMRGLRPGMPTADHDDVKMFHVKHLSLTQAKAGENLVENHLDIYPSYQRIKRTDSYT